MLKCMQFYVKQVCVCGWNMDFVTKKKHFQSVAILLDLAVYQVHTDALGMACAFQWYFLAQYKVQNVEIVLHVFRRKKINPITNSLPDSFEINQWNKKKICKDHSINLSFVFKFHKVFHGCFDSIRFIYDLLTIECIVNDAVYCKIIEPCVLCPKFNVDTMYDNLTVRK